jgi:hypothetical protein
MLIYVFIAVGRRSRRGAKLQLLHSILLLRRVVCFIRYDRHVHICR